MDTTRPCSCQGTNERCYKCDGTGYLPERHTAKPMNTPSIAIRLPTKKRRGAPARAGFKTGRSAQAPIQRQQQTLPPPRMMLRLPDDAPKPMYLVREGIRFTHCNRCGFYVVSERYLVHDDICAHRQVRPPLPAHRPPVLSRVAKPQDRVTCVHCKNMVNLKNMARHLRRSHGLDPAQAPQTAAMTSAPVPTSALLLTSGTAAGYLLRGGVRYTRCGACNKDIRSERFLVHVEICPSLSKHRKPGVPIHIAPPKERAGSPAARPHAGVQATISAMEACAVCGCMVRQNNMKRHQRRAHPPAPAPHPAQKGRKQAPSQKSASVGSMLQRETGSQMDAIKHLGYFARESGRFGSMPSYDDYSDEGGPD